MLGHFKIGIRLLMMSIFAIAGMIAIGAAGLNSLHNALLTERQAATRSIVEAARTIIADFQRRAELKEFTVEEAQNRALAAIKALRYANNDYVFLYDNKATALYVPDTKIIGQNCWDVQDANGVYLIRELIQKALAGGGFSYYHYPRYSQGVASEPLPKLSYSAPFEPWGWVVGTGTYIDDIDAAVWRQFRFIALVGAAVLVIVTGAAYVIGRSITGPLTTITGAMARLAGGDRAIEIRHAERRDEIGLLAQALAAFKTNAIEIERLKSEQEAAKQRAEATRQQEMRSLADHFERSVSAIVASVTAGAAQMKQSALTLNDIAETTSRQSTVVATGSEEASVNVQTVAAATEQLSSSIAEIARQVDQASRVALSAKSEAELAQATVNGLAEAAQKIGEVVRLISSIAAQTNLLALNATIEAARAGDAGKGFAVVAGEVKLLATQTARATEDITSQIGEVQNASGKAVQAITGIGQTIGQINETSSAIAAAVEEQGAATREITTNVERAARGTQEVSENISGVRDGAVSTGRAATEVLAASDRLAGEIAGLRSEVEAFLGHIRAT